MMLWILFGAMALVIVILVLWPLLRGGPAVRARHEYDLEVYRDQLAEIDRDMARGLLTAEQAKAARIEVQRRILAASTGAGPEGENRRPILIAIAVAIVLPIAAFALYGKLGAPNLQDQPFTERIIAHLDMPRDKAREMIDLVEKLEARMQARPGDPEGWRMLGRSYLALGRPDAAADAFKAATEHGAEDGETLAALGEALVLSTGGVVGPEAKRAFDAALARQPADPRARFYIALARAQAGDARGAIALWRGLAEEANPDAPFLSTLRARIAELAAAARIDPDSIPPERTVPGSTPSPAPAQPSPDAAPPMDQDQRQMVEAMVAGLASRLQSHPDDFEGWMRLGRSYTVLGRLDAAKSAWEKAIGLRPVDIGAKLGLAETLVASLPDPQGPLPPEAVGLLREINALDPNQPDALYYLGRHEAQAGQPAVARALWQRLLGQLPEGSPARQDIEARIRKLPNGR